MTRMYGHKWLSNFGECDKDDTWAEGLADLTNAELRRGYLACINSGDAWPPSMPEFRALCRPIAPQKRENESMYRMPPSHQLTHKLSDEARASGRAALASLKVGLIGPRA